MSDIKYELVSNDYVAPDPAAAEVVTPEASPVVEPVVTATAEAVPDLAPEVDHWEKLGFEKGGGDFAKIADAYKTGKLREYVDISSRDYAKVSDEDAIKSEIEEKYSMLTPDERDIIYKNKLARDYGITGDDNEDIAGRVMMKADAHNWRTRKQEEQSKYQIPTYTPPAAAPSEEQLQQQQLAEQMTRMISEHPALSSFELNKIVQLGTGDDTFGFEAKTFDAKSALLSPDGLLKQVFRVENGQPVLDGNKLLKIFTYAYHMEDIERALIEHGKTLKDKQVFTELRNVETEVTPATPAVPPKYQVVG